MSDVGHELQSRQRAAAAERNTATARKKNGDGRSTGLKHQLEIVLLKRRLTNVDNHYPPLGVVARYSEIINSAITAIFSTAVLDGDDVSQDQ